LAPTNFLNVQFIAIEKYKVDLYNPGFKLVIFIIKFILATILRYQPFTAFFLALKIRKWLANSDVNKAVAKSYRQ